MSAELYGLNWDRPAASKSAVFNNFLGSINN
jgi:hypothetical protein